jgi:hypothetical protein
MKSKIILTVAGFLSFAVAAFQAVLTFSPAWCRYFGAPESLVSNLILLYVSSTVVTILFAICGLYALSGAGTFRRLPLLRTGLVFIGVLFTLRGLPFIQLFLIRQGVLQSSVPIPPTALESSLVFLVIGVAYLTGTVGRWLRLKVK